MSRNRFMLFFPEYRESVSCTRDYWTYSELATDDDIKEQVKRLVEFIDFFREEDCEMLYDPKNVQAHVYPLDTLPDCYPDRKRLYYMALKGLGKCQEDSMSSSGKVYSFNHQVIPYDLRCEMAERCLTDKEHSYILVLHADHFNASSYAMEWDSNCLQMLCYPTDIRQVFSWLSKHRFPKRIYNWNPKHGENGRGAHRTHAGEPVSVLCCSKEQAAELMDQAIGERGYDTLFIYDTRVGKYMEFKAEKKDSALTDQDQVRLYHSYHIENEDRISKEVKKKLAKLMMK